MTRAPPDADLGGEAPCWAHLLPEADHDLDTRADIDRLVRDFYRQVAMDDLLGPVFSHAHVDWSVHLPKLADFWAWQLFGERDYTGNPLRAHEPAHAQTPFDPRHYERWLELFDATIDELFQGPNADFAKRRAHQMARSLRRLLDGHTSTNPEESEPGALRVSAVCPSPLTATRTRDLDTRAEIHDLVVHFYREVALDDLLAPVFGEVAETDWAIHIPRLIDYWSQVLLGDPGYDGAVLAAHRCIHELEPFRAELFDRWYCLFVESVDGRWAGPKAELAKAHAARTAAILARRLLALEWSPQPPLARTDQ